MTPTRSSVNPCFVAEGEEIPTDAAPSATVTEPAPFTGTETFYNSGFLPDGETFVVELADDIAPGTYYAFCTLHFVEMISEITVVPADEPVPTPEEVPRRVRRSSSSWRRWAYRRVEEAEAAATPGHVHAGLGSEESTKVLVAEFVPPTSKDRVGEPVTLTIAGPHTVSFNAPEEARTVLVKGDDGGFHIVGGVGAGGYEPPPAASGGAAEDAPPPRWTAARGTAPASSTRGSCSAATSCCGSASRARTSTCAWSIPRCRARSP